MTKSLFLEWYKDDFKLNVKAFGQRENKMEQVLLLMDNAPSHPEVDVLNGADKDFQVMFLPPNVTVLNIAHGSFIKANVCIRRKCYIDYF